jgi:hypothetical protein
MTNRYFLAAFCNAGAGEAAVPADGKMVPALMTRPFVQCPEEKKKGKSKFFHDARKARATAHHFTSRQKLAAAAQICPLNPTF